ncbi:MAG: HPP family protein [Motiliproteus sp.]|nr:HPP family protein [Motiliproteus sp.]
MFSISAKHWDRLFTAFGGFVGIYGIMWVSGEVLEKQGAAMLVGSIGATLILLFVAPHASLSQPWAVFGGHLCSAVVGVSCVKVFPDPILSASAALGISIAVMHYLSCVHPPGGATALVAVLGGDSVLQLGYGFVVFPVLINVVIVLGLVFIANLPFSHRRYPAIIAYAKK